MSTTRDPNADERRATPRNRSLKVAHVVFNNHRSSYEALVRNLTDDGARLQFADRADLPSSFEIRVGTDGPYRRAEKRWQLGFDIGIRFLRDAA